MSNWKKKTGLFERKFVSRQIGGQTWNFYPVSVARIFELRTTIHDLFVSVSALFAKNADDVGQEIERITQGSDKIERTHIAAISPDLASLRSTQRAEAIGKSVNALFSETNKMALGRLLCDSLREEFEPTCPDDEVRSFLNDLDLPTLVEFLMGFAEANIKVFGPVGEKMRAALKTKLEGLASVAQGENDPAPDNRGS